MKSTKHFRLAVGILLGLFALVALPGLASAHDGHHAKKQKKTKKVAIGFKAVNGSKPVTCGQPITDLGTTGRTAKLTDLRFYVTGVQLLRKGGGTTKVKLNTGSKWSYKKGKSAVTLIDLENGKGSCADQGTKGKNAFVKGTVPKGKYVGVRYSVSVPSALNHTNVTTTPSPLNLTAMAWSWQAGHKFMKVEVSEGDTPAWGSKTFYLHLGSTDGTGDPAAGESTRCALPNRNKITLKKFNPAKQRIALDFKRLLAGVDVAGSDMSGMGGMNMAGMDMEMDDSADMGGMDMGAMGGCMSSTSSPDCGPLFEALGMKLGTKKKTAQTAFRVVRK